MSDYTRKKSDILAVVPRSVGFGQEVTMNEMYIPHANFGVIERIDNIKNMTIWLTDENGNEVDFGGHHFHVGILLLPVTTVHGLEV